MFCFLGHRTGDQRVLLDSFTEFILCLERNKAHGNCHCLMKLTMFCKCYKHKCLISLHAVQNIINGGFKAAKCSPGIVNKPQMHLPSWHVYSALLNTYFTIKQHRNNLRNLMSWIFRRLLPSSSWDSFSYPDNPIPSILCPETGRNNPIHQEQLQAGQRGIVWMKSSFAERKVGQGPAMGLCSKKKNKKNNKQTQGSTGKSAASRSKEVILLLCISPGQNSQ